MKRSWNAAIWGGFALSIVAVLSYFFVFIRFPETRDVPWVTFVLLGLAVVLVAIGLKRAYGQPERYRGKISGMVLGSLSLALVVLFAWFTISLTKDLPPPANALAAGQQAPDFTLADENGKPVSLSELIGPHAAVLLIFYRGYW